MSQDPPHSVLAAKAPSRVVVVGGVGAGLSAAVRARRSHEGAEIVVLEPGTALAFPHPNLAASIASTQEGEALGLTREQLVERFRLEARLGHDVLRVDREQQRVEGRDRCGHPFALAYDQLILAPRSTPILPEIPGNAAANVFVLTDLDAAERLRAFLVQAVPINAVVLGAGSVGLELAAALAQRGLNVTVLESGAHALPELDSSLRPPVEAELRSRGLQVHPSTRVRALHRGETGEVEAVETDARGVIATDLVVVCLGARPATALGKSAGLRLGPQLGIAVDAECRTSDAHIFAVGDCAEASPGAALRARLFGVELGLLGLGLPAARAAGHDADQVLVRAEPQPNGAPDDGAPGRLLLVHERASTRLLGAQVVGASGLERLLGVLATSLHFNATLADLVLLGVVSRAELAGHTALNAR